MAAASTHPPSQQVGAEEELAALQRRMEALRDEQSHEAEALLHELLLTRLRQPSGGGSNTASGGHAAGSGPEVRQPGGSGGTALGSAEATLAPAPRGRRPPAAQPDSSNGSGGPSGGTLVGSAEGVAAVPGQAAALPDQQQAFRPGATPPASAAAQRHRDWRSMQQQQQQGTPPAPRLHLHYLHPAHEAALSGGSGNNTPLSSRSIESAWSDSGAWCGWRGVAGGHGTSALAVWLAPPALC